MTQPAQQSPGTCNQCLYWSPLEVGGYCHFNAPRVGDDSGNILGGRVIWPRTLPTDWCGQWAQSATVRETQVVDG